MLYKSLQSFLINENLKQAKAYINKLGLDPESKKGEDVDRAQKLVNMVATEMKNYPNLIGAIVKMMVRKDDSGNISFDDRGFSEITNWINTHKNLIGKLPKNLNQYENLEQLHDDIDVVMTNQKVMKFVSTLYKSMRDEYKNLDGDDRIRFNNLAIEFLKLKPEHREQFTPLKYFQVNNISLKEFIESLESFINDNTVNSFQKNIMEKIKKHQNDNKLNVVYNKDNVVVIKTSSKEVVCDLGSQRWCIVYSADTYGEQYYGEGSWGTQYIVFNFNLPASNRYSQYGITIKYDGEAMSGGCQDKNNVRVDLETIYKNTNIDKNEFQFTSDFEYINDYVKDINKKVNELEKSETPFIDLVDYTASLDDGYSKDIIYGKYKKKLPINLDSEDMARFFNINLINVGIKSFLDKYVRMSEIGDNESDEWIIIFDEMLNIIAQATHHDQSRYDISEKVDYDTFMESIKGIEFIVLQSSYYAHFEMYILSSLKTESIAKFLQEQGRINGRSISFLKDYISAEIKTIDDFKEFNDQFVMKYTNEVIKHINETDKPVINKIGEWSLVTNSFKNTSLILDIMMRTDPYEVINKIPNIFQYISIYRILPYHNIGHKLRTEIFYYLAYYVFLCRSAINDEPYPIFYLGDEFRGSHEVGDINTDHLFKLYSHDSLKKYIDYSTDKFYIIYHKIVDMFKDIVKKETYTKFSEVVYKTFNTSFFDSFNYFFNNYMFKTFDEFNEMYTSTLDYIDSKGDNINYLELLMYTSSLDSVEFYYQDLFDISDNRSDAGYGAELSIMSLIDKFEGVELIKVAKFIDTYGKYYNYGLEKLFNDPVLIDDSEILKKVVYMYNNYEGSNKTTKKLSDSFLILAYSLTEDKEKKGVFYKKLLDKVSVGNINGEHYIKLDSYDDLEAYYDKWPYFYESLIDNVDDYWESKTYLNNLDYINLRNLLSLATHFKKVGYDISSSTINKYNKQTYYDMDIRDQSRMIWKESDLVDLYDTVESIINETYDGEDDIDVSDIQDGFDQAFNQTVQGQILNQWEDDILDSTSELFEYWNNDNVTYKWVGDELLFKVDPSKFIDEICEDKYSMVHFLEDYTDADGTFTIDDIITFYVENVDTIDYPNLEWGYDDVFDSSYFNEIFTDNLIDIGIEQIHIDDDPKNENIKFFKDF